MNSVLITGGTGSLGSAVAGALQAERICIYSRDEYKQAEMRREIMASVDDRCLTCGVRSRIARRCGACRRASYCGEGCQRLDWRRHQTPCRATRHQPVPVEVFSRRHSGEPEVQKK